MQKILDYFKVISSIPRCSFKTDCMRKKIVEISKELGFSVEVDRTGNIIAKKGSPKICLQSHYDMVCVGDYENIELITTNGILRAKSSSLGADNGMGMAIMFAMMEKFDNLECLFTNNEEVGLIGAKELELEIKADNLLNLDGEEAGDIYIGCAGGVDVISTINLEYENLDTIDEVFEISIDGLDGGHSGVDIDKNRPNAIKLLARELLNLDAKLIEINGGEFRNSIPRSASAIVSFDKNLTVDSKFKVKKVDNEEKFIKNSSKILKTIYAFAQGVRGYSKEFLIPLSSVNLGLIKTDDGVLKIDCSCRAMSGEDLDQLAQETKSFFELIGCSVKFSSKHAPWIPKVGEFANFVKRCMLKDYEGADFRAIHAGLECGLLISSQKKRIEAVSIGPTIRNPHSLNEECDLKSVEKISLVVERIINGIN